MGQCGSGGNSSKKRRKCGSFSELWVSVGLLGNCGSLWVRRLRVRKEGRLGLLVNCGSLWVIVGHCG